MHLWQIGRHAVSQESGHFSGMVDIMYRAELAEFSIMEKYIADVF